MWNSTGLKVILMVFGRFVTVGNTLQHDAQGCDKITQDKEQVNIPCFHPFQKEHK